MSVQKLVAEADKLLERSKLAEAILKLNQALQEEPLNQLVATKLANAHVSSQAPEEASKVYSALARRLSDAGKAQVAVAIFKQALELAPDDVALRVRFAQECESVGKLGEAYLQAQNALQYYVSRKKYFDAAGLMPLISRAQPRDETIKHYWIEMIQMSQAETKLPNLLVALCGPPGLSSPEFSVGGDPAALSDALYEALRKLVPFFPRDPKLAYAVAWSAYRRGRMKDFYHYLHETLRRDPDFCLAIILFARALADEQRLNESFFVFKHFKERMPTDRSSDMLTLNRQLEAFTEKNGWVKFTEASQAALDPQDFVATVMGEKKSEPGLAGMGVPVEPEPEETKTLTTEPPPPMEEAPQPAEIELSLDSSQEVSEVLLTDGSTLTGTLAPVGVENTPSPTPAPTPTTERTVVRPSAPPEPAEAPEREVEFTGLIAAQAGDWQAVEAPGALTSEGTPTEGGALGMEEAAAEPLAETEPPPAPPAGGPKIVFNPMPEAAPETAAAPETPPPEREERTAMFSPMELLDAARVRKGSELPEALARSSASESPVPPVPPPAPAKPPVEAEPAEADNPKWRNLMVEGERTMMFSPVEAVEAASESRRPIDAVIAPPPPPAPAAAEPPSYTPTPPPPPVAAGKPADPQVPAPESPSEAVPDAASLERFEEPTRVVMAPPPVPEEALAQLEAAAAPTEAPAEGPEPTRDVPRPEPEPENEAPGIPGLPGVAFMPIPDAPAAAMGQPEEQVDLGDDLLDGATRVLTQPTAADKTEHLLKEIKRELEERPGTHKNADLLLRKADRYTAKRNYYLARKALRHAQALGADEAMVKEKLRVIRKLELPEALFNKVSSDRASRVDTEELLDRLEQELGLSSDSSEEAGEIAPVVESQLEEIFASHDARTILDFGIGLHEMGMFRLAERIYQRVTDDFPDFAFDAYYLAAMAKLARKDYAGAASVLKRLSADSARSDPEKIQIYYALGETFEKMRQPERSKELFRKVAEIDAGYRNVRHKLED